MAASLRGSLHLAGRGIFAWVCAGLLLLAVSALAAELPALTGRVVDNAGLLDSQTEAALTEKLAGFETKSSDQIVVATIQSLDGEVIEPYANRLFRAWGLGHAGEDNGVLLLVALNDRRMRIEVGYGLEGTLTDLHAKLIIENTMVPAFRAGDYARGITGAVDDIVTVLEGNAAELEARARRTAEENAEPIWPVVLFFIVWSTIFFGGFAFAFLPQLLGHRTGRNKYRWLGMDFDYTSRGGSSGSSGWSSGSSSGGFSGGGGSSGGGGASGSW
ncbi:TPM domain-containing protein [Chelativorans salis]|uniref:YgcG family protein n=1 Tax=Chelativorans salis TaxID=2978478 RepID=A0ABT2LPN9_9HYPH|nr:YgcG family protein [Chelativorans sp. EGI FJ00035]MCT7376525.1 YgcG family protein [Chelativorans sp. EGI FJ00035]